jgi:hypothetical protein
MAVPARGVPDVDALCDSTWPFHSPRSTSGIKSSILEDRHWKEVDRYGTQVHEYN